MIPNLFIYCEKIPININGKIDRKKLPKPHLKDLQSNICISPTNEKEKLVSNLYEEVLELENISITDDFFNLGGNSIKAILLTAKLQYFFNVDISKIFALRTIQNLAEALEFHTNN